MKKSFFLVIFILFYFSSLQSQILSPELEKKINLAGENEYIRAVIKMKDRLSISHLKSLTAGKTKTEARDIVRSEVKDFGQRSQNSILGYLRQTKQVDDAKYLDSIYTTNTIIISAKKNIYEELRKRNDIAFIYIEKKFYTPCNTTWNVEKIEAEDVWSDIGIEGLGIVVAVIDGGTDYNHSDLHNNIRNNSGEDSDDDGHTLEWNGNEWVLDPGDINGIDDDGNSLVDDLIGYDFCTSDDGVRDIDPMDESGHGTHVSGTVCGDGSSGTQTGVAPGANIMCFKISSPGDSTYASDIISAIEFVYLESCCDLINLSQGFIYSTQIPMADTRADFRTVCDAATTAGVIMCVAAGNEGSANQVPYNLRTPGDVPSVITVGATTIDDEVATKDNCETSPIWGSSIGPVSWENVPGYNDYPYNPPSEPGLLKPDISAPGAIVTSTKLNGGYEEKSGTSMATPAVSGLVALLLSVNPSLTPAQAKAILQATADKVGQFSYTNGRNDYIGYGRVNAHQALLYTLENYGGTIGGDGQTLTFHEDITIEGGAELTIAPGTIIKFEPDEKLTIKGTLSANDVTFESTSMHGEWGGLVFDGSSCSSSALYECTIETAIVGITITGSNASPTIEKCLVQDCDSYPLKLTSDCTPNIYNNKFYADYSHAAYISSADGDFNENEFRTSGGTTYGVYITGASSDPDFDSKEGDSGNLFDLSVIASHGAYAAGGHPEFGDTGPHDGKNDFINRGADKYIYNNTGSTIDAEVNYWGGTPQTSWFSGSVDFSPYESSPNGAGPTWKALNNPYAAGMELYENGQYEDALAALQSALQQDTESEKASSAVFKMAKSALKLNRLASDESFLKMLLSSPNLEVRYMSRVWLAYLYAMQGQIEEAEKIALQAPEGTRSQRAELLSLVSYYITFGDQQSAERIARILQEKHKDDYLEYDLEVAMETKLEFPKGMTKSSSELAKTLVCKSYPNPFNPSTTIQFDLPENKAVTLQIFDILGRLVHTLVDEEMVAGSYSVQWNGKNSAGHDVSAGVYFASIRTRNEINTIKLLLVR
ncbi:S8 family serine peptidase [candidate division KSB1 bacterium]|nr:S8 family serine peptidase [candidate division KSB1 bacterium]